MIRTQGGSVVYVCTKFQEDSSVQKLLGSPKISKLSHVTLSYGPFETETLNLCKNPSNHIRCHILYF